MVFGLKVASKIFTIIYNVELGKPVVLPYSGSSSVRSNNGAAGRGYDKKRMLIRNRLDRGFCLNLKGADLSWMFHCMNRDKPMNVRKSITLKSEILIDTNVLLGCKLELQRQN